MCHIKTTLEVGEEDRFVTTMAVGEEGCTSHHGEELSGFMTTEAQGEEGPDLDPALAAVESPFGGF